MILVLFFLALLLIGAFFTARLEFEIKKFKFSNETDKLKKEISLSIKLYAFSFIKVFQKNIEDKDLKKNKYSKQIKKLKEKEKGKNKIEFKDGYLALKKLNIKKLYLDVELGTEDPILTSFVVYALSVLISVSLARVIKKFDTEKYMYNILPKYDNKNTIKINLSGIVDIKLVNIINIILNLLIRSDKNDKRASYRKLNVNSNEQYTANDRC